MASDLTQRVATAVRVQLALRGWQHKTLAEKIGMKPAVLGHRLRGEVPFSLHEIAMIAAVFGIPDTDLIDFEVVGRAAGNSGQHPVSSAPGSPTGEADSRERLDRPAAYPLIRGGGAA